MGKDPPHNPAAQRALVRKNRSWRDCRPLAERPTCLGWSAPGRGGLRTPAMGELASPEHVPPRPPGVHLPPVTMICLGLSPASPRGRAERVPPRKAPLAPSADIPRKASPPRLGPSRRGGLRTPARTPLAPLDHFPDRPPALRLPPGRHAIPGLACGLPTRTRRPRPSEKTTIRIVPGFSPEASHPSLPPRGGAGSARPQGLPSLHLGMSP